MSLVKNSVSFVIYGACSEKVLAVLRPEYDDLPNVWGLPAGSLRPGETFEDAVLRSGMEKLGVDVRVVKLINQGRINRPSYALHMRVYEAEIIKGCPHIPKPVKGITQYQKWCWVTPDILVPAAQKGSLCTRLFLKKEGLIW